MSELPRADEALKEALGPVLELDRRLAERETALAAQLAELKAERARLRQVVRLVERPDPNGRKDVSKPKPKSVTIAEANVQRVADVVATLEGDFGQPDVKEQLPDMQAEMIRKAFVVLRDRGQIRLVKVVRGRGGGYTFTTTPKGRHELADPITVNSNGPEPS